VNRDQHGFSLAEALVGLALLSLAAGMLATSVRTAAGALALARDTGAAVVAAQDALGHMQAGVRTSGNDTLAGEPRITRSWTWTSGRGRPGTAVVRAGWGSHEIVLESALWP